MRRTFAVSLILIAMFAAGSVDLGACGDKFLRVGRSARFRRYAAVYPASILIYKPVDATPAGMKEIKWKDGTGHGTGPDSYLMFALPQPTFVAGVRIRWSHSNGTTTFFRAFWRRSDTSDFPETYQYYWSFGLEDPLTIYIADTIDQIRIHPDLKPVDFTISEIVLLVPATN